MTKLVNLSKTVPVSLRKPSADGRDKTAGYRAGIGRINTTHAGR